MGQPDGHCGNHRGGGQPGGCSEFEKHLDEVEGAGVSNPRGGSGEAEDRGGKSGQRAGGVPGVCTDKAVHRGNCQTEAGTGES